MSKLMACLDSKIRVLACAVATFTAFAAMAGTTSVSTVGELTAALEAAKDGDEIVLATGAYKLTSAYTIANGVTIRSASGKAEDVVMTAANNKQLFILNHASAKLQNLTLQGGKISSGQNLHGSNVRIADAGGTVEGCIIRNGYLSCYVGRNAVSAAVARAFRASAKMDSSRTASLRTMSFMSLRAMRRVVAST